MKVSVVIPAAGRGKRMGAEENKLFLLLRSKPVIEHTLAAFAGLPEVQEIILVGHKEDIKRLQAIAAAYPLVGKVVEGGEERFDSVWRGLQHVSSTDIIMIHDAARPLVSQKLIQQTAQKAMQQGAALAAIPERDTVKRSADGRTVLKTVPRKGLWRAQTPQAFHRQSFLDSYARAVADGFSATDDAMVAERYGMSIHLVEGSEKNLKITTPEDLHYAEYLLSL